LSFSCGFLFAERKEKRNKKKEERVELMKHRAVTDALLERFKEHLYREERSVGTIEKYGRDLKSFQKWLDGGEVTWETVNEWREFLIGRGLKPTTVNGMLAALRAFCRWAGWTEVKVKTLRLQRRAFRECGKELTREEYRQLCNTARNRGKERLALAMETICATGIRVSEVRGITVEAVREGRAEIRLKGKIRTILLPGKLCRKLLKYAKKQHISSGEIFVSRRGNPLSRKQIWAEMKALCEEAGVEASKVFPHNLRHLFAVCFYRTCRDVVRLADVLGHSSVETTRIYLISSGAEHIRTLEQLKLIC